MVGVQPEVDLLFETPQGMQAVEVKYGSTVTSGWPDAILKWQKFTPYTALAPVIVYGGDGDHERQGLFCRLMVASLFGLQPS